MFKIHSLKTIFNLRNHTDSLFRLVTKLLPFFNFAPKNYIRFQGAFKIICRKHQKVKSSLRKVLCNLHKKIYFLRLFKMLQNCNFCVFGGFTYILWKKLLCKVTIILPVISIFEGEKRIFVALSYINCNFCVTFSFFS